MKVISSQRYLDEGKVQEKIKELRGQESITLTTWETGIEDLYVLGDGHHTLAAAKELGIEIHFEEGEHPEGLTGEELLEQAWIDSDWYYIDTGKDVW